MHTKGASNVNPGLHMGSQTPFVREVFPSQVPARPLSGGMVKLVHVVGSAVHTTFVNVPAVHLADVSPFDDESSVTRGFASHPVSHLVTAVAVPRCHRP